jgi:cysteate synthase
MITSVTISSHSLAQERETLPGYDRHFRLKCQICNSSYEDDSFLLECSAVHAPSLLVTDYENKKFEPDGDAEGIYRYRRWLPIVRTLKCPGRTVTYQSEKLCRLTGLPNLWIAFNGYWPEKEAWLETATFKELEAYSVLARIPEKQNGILVVASAGNTAAAFARACSLNSIPCLIIVPEGGLKRIQSTAPCVKIVSLTGDTDYSDAITLAERISKLDGFFPEGGAKNVARRDGLATTMLSAVETIGRMPDYYFQAVGSGTGGIAVHEAAKRLVEDRRYGHVPPRLMLSQNLPFVPMYLSWKSGRRELIGINADDGKKQIQQIAASVLSNRKPPYSIKGGVFDALNEARGDMFVADNYETLYAGRLFEETEEIDIDPASAVAFATLRKAARDTQMERDSVVLLHITGGGWHRQNADKNFKPASSDLQLDEREILTDHALEQTIRLFP